MTLHTWRLALALPLFIACSGGKDEATDDTDMDMTDDTTTDTTDTMDTTDTTVDTTCQTDICATYGAAVPAVAAGIVQAAATDPMFSDDFAPLVAEGEPAVEAFTASLANFISDAYGCTTGAYTGPSMEAAHAGMNITQEDYDAFIGLIAGVLDGAGVPADDINYCFAPPLVAPAFVATIVGQ